MDKAKKCKRIKGFEVCRKDGATRQKQQYEIKSGEAVKGQDCKTKCLQFKVMPSNIPYDWDKRKKDKYCQVTYKDMDDAKRTYAEWLENERRRAIISSGGYL